MRGSLCVIHDPDHFPGRASLRCRCMHACPRCSIKWAFCTSGHCSTKHLYYQCTTARIQWGIEHFATTPTAELPTKDTFEVLGADYYFEPETDSIIHLHSSVSDTGFPLEDDTPPGDGSPPESLESPQSEVLNTSEQGVARGGKRYPRCPDCGQLRVDSDRTLIGKCKRRGRLYTCRPN